MPSDRGDQMETGQRSKSLRSLSTCFSDRSDRNDHMETGLNIHTRTCTRARTHSHTQSRNIHNHACRGAGRTPTHQHVHKNMCKCTKPRGPLICQTRPALASVLGPFGVHLLTSGALMHYLGSLKFPVICDTQFILWLRSLKRPGLSITFDTLFACRSFEAKNYLTFSHCFDGISFCSRVYIY